jgi:hypothetical protein
MAATRQHRGALRHDLVCSALAAVSLDTREVRLSAGADTVQGRSCLDFRQGRQDAFPPPPPREPHDARVRLWQRHELTHGGGPARDWAPISSRTARPVFGQQAIPGLGLRGRSRPGGAVCPPALSLSGNHGGILDVQHTRQSPIACMNRQNPGRHRCPPCHCRSKLDQAPV